MAPYKITCLDADNGTDFGLAMFQFDLKLNHAIAGCGKGMKVPVQVYNNESGLESREWSYYARLIERGFVMKWNSTDCSRCLVSGGKCGHDLTGTTFQCFCPDRPHNVYCSEGSSRRELKLIIGRYLFHKFLLDAIIVKGYHSMLIFKLVLN